MRKLYSLNKKRVAVARFFRVSHNRAATFEPVQTIFPGHMAPIIKQSENGERELAVRSWGFICCGMATHRSASPTRAMTRPTRGSGRIVSRSAAAWCRPQRFASPTRASQWFALTGKDERPLFAFPGRQWKGPIKKDGPNVDIEVFSFMTTLPNTLTATINHERSPVILTEEEQFTTWLQGSPEEAFVLIKTSDPDRMQIVQSGLGMRDLLQAA